MLRHILQTEKGLAGLGLGRRAYLNFFTAAMGKAAARAEMQVWNRCMQVCAYVRTYACIYNVTKLAKQTQTAQIIQGRCLDCSLAADCERSCHVHIL